jgi:hypothetical protein
MPPSLCRVDSPALTDLDEHGRAVSLRKIVCHMIEEWARPNGHADLIRESVDGSPESSCLLAGLND